MVEGRQLSLDEAIPFMCRRCGRVLDSQAALRSHESKHRSRDRMVIFGIVAMELDDRQQQALFKALKAKNIDEAARELEALGKEVAEAVKYHPEYFKELASMIHVEEINYIA